VDIYPQTVIFGLARPCITVHAHGELETQFDDGDRNTLDTLDEFRSAWQATPRAAAVVAPETWPTLQSPGLDAQVLFSTSTMVVIARTP
jgi:hypothetical protein